MLDISQFLIGGPTTDALVSANQIARQHMAFPQISDEPRSYKWRDAGISVCTAVKVDGRRLSAR